MSNNIILRHNRSLGFTIIELIIVISVIGVLVTITGISYNNWGQSTTIAQLKNDLNGVASAMENARTFGSSGYPADVNSLTTFTKSNGTTLSGGSADGGKTYCISAQSGSLKYHVSSNDNLGVQPGTCAIITPDPPGMSIVYYDSTASGVTTFTWPNASCGANSARFQYRLTSTPSGYDSGLVATNNLSASVSTATYGDTYTMAVQIQCYNSDTSTGWSTARSATYIRSNFNLTLIAGSNGTVSGGGTYMSGSTTTMTATPNSGYALLNWTGSGNCDGFTSHTIQINSQDKTCTANFYLKNWIAGVGGTPLQGKYVLNQDLSWSSVWYSPTLAVCSTTQCTVGLDTTSGYAAKNAIKSPQLNPGIDFTDYPAQNECKLVGGRLPYVGELTSIYANQATYGSLSQTFYWSATEYDYSTSYYISSGAVHTLVVKQYPMYTRCVKD